MTTNCSSGTGAPAAQQGSRLALPMLGHTRGSRSAQTCHFRCGDACLTENPSASTALRFEDLAQQAIGRRSVLAGLGAAVVAGAALVPEEAFAAGRGRGSRAAAAASAPGAMAPAGAMAGFAPVGPIPSDVDDLVVPHGWDWHSIIAWGDAVERGAPEFDLDHQSAEAQLRQFGYNCDYLTVLPLDASGKRSLLVANHEYTNENLMYPGYTDDESLTVEQRRISMAAHGMSVVEVRRDGPGSPWRAMPSRYGRRITASTTEFRLTGPVAGSELVRTSADPDGTTVIGTFNNCAGGTTPWGTVLSGEENFQGYFKTSDQLDLRNVDAYGVSDTGRGWELADARFDTAQEPNEPNRFGWIVELNPYDPFSTPKKLTALGRFRHEGATASIAPDGRVVCYMGDDTGDQHLYKFISRDRVAQRPRRGRGYDVLEHGDLYVARFSVEGEPSSDYDGTGEWVPLTKDGRSMVPGMTLEEVLVFTRTAAAAVGATPMDRPEDVQRNPVTGRVYMACTNNTGREEVDPANPRVNNRYGHIVEVTEAEDQTSTTFTWALPVVCGDPSDPSTYFSGLPASEVMPIACPDNVAFDAYGGLWVSTDGQPGSLDLNDALHHVATEGPDRGKVQTFLTVPVGAETCGPVVDAEEGTVLVCVQHPGEVDGASVENTVSFYPYDGVARVPRPGVAQAIKRR